MNNIANVKRPKGAKAGDRGARPRNLGARTGDVRTYESPLRDEQALRTRERILDALVRIMARGVTEISMPAVAREAGVSVPTVYRHFGSKRRLVADLAGYLLPRTGMLPDRPPDDLDGIVGVAQTMFRRYERMDATIRAAMASGLGNDVRRERMPDRVEYFRIAVRGSRPDLDPADVERFANVLVILFSSSSMRAFKDYLDLTPDDAADHVTWAIEHLLKGL